MHVRALVLALVMLGGATGCDLLRLQQALIVSSLRGAGLREARVELGDARVRYWSRDGVGVPVVLVHGFGAAAHWQWYETIEAFPGRPIVMADLLWFGGSSSPSRDHSLDHQVRVVLALLDRLGHARVDIVGISYGGLVAYELAGSHPARVRRLVVLDSPGRAYTRPDYEALCRRFGVDDVSEVLVPEDERGVRRLLELAYAEPPWVPDYFLWQALDVLYAAHRSEQVYLLHALVRDLEMLRARPDPTAETLLIWGRDDPVFPLEIGRRLARRLGARLEIIERARHAPTLERPHEVNALLRGFLHDGSQTP